MSKRRKAIKIPVRYTVDGVDIEYVSRSHSELRPELRRVQDAIRDALRILSNIRFTRHAVLDTATFQLRHCIRPVADDCTDQQIADEIARLSYAMDDTIAILGILSNSRTRYLEEARFRLRYGQTPKKRDIESICSERRTNYEFDDDRETDPDYQD